MDFTYNSYKDLIKRLKNNNYDFVNYNNYEGHEKCVIMRHDVDYSVDKALQFAELENELGIKAVYFVLVSSPFYNIASKAVHEKLLKIISLGHVIGLHFDETNYSEEYYNKCGGFEAVINNEIVILKGLLDLDITCVSMHRPSKKTLEANYDLYPNKNSYGDEFFKKFKYVSDSRHRWRENITEIIDSNRYNKLHILTHAFWYNEYPEDIKTTILKFIMQSPHSRYEMIEQNIVGLSEIIEENEIDISIDRVK